MTSPRLARRASGTGSALTATFVGIVCTASVTTALGDWPDTPASPLELGPVSGFSSSPPATAVTPDGATWIAWVDMECFGSLRLQRIDANGSLLASEGLALDPITNCVGRAARLTGCADGSVLVCAVAGAINSTGQLGDMPIRRIGPDGSPLWKDGVVVAANAFGNIGGFFEVSDGGEGDVLIAWFADTNVFVNRYTAEGSPAWRQPASIAVPHGPTMRIFGVVPDDDGGVYVLWDAPGPYTRAIFAARFTGEGMAAWRTPIHLTAVTPGSMHSSPVAIADGSGGVVVAWKEGLEQSQLPAPLFLQRIHPDGSLAFNPAGVLVSLDDTPQFDPVVSRDPVSDDLFIAWRDVGPTLRAQRLTQSGERLWGDSGVAVASMTSPTSFHGLWDGESLLLAIARFHPPGGDDPRVSVHRVSGKGVIADDVWPVSGPLPAANVRLASLPDAFAVTWCADLPGFPDEVVAQRLNPDGTLGMPAPTPGDLDGDGVVNGADLGQLLAAWKSSDAVADLNGDGVVDGADLGLLLGEWTE